jgi:hypothetical protein
MSGPETLFQNPQKDPMDIVKMVAALREERARLEEVIIAMEGLARGRAKRPGRPPAWMSAMRTAGPRRGRPPGSKNKVKMHAAV